RTALTEAAAAGALGGSVAESLARDGPWVRLLAPVAASWAACEAAGAPLAPALAGVSSALAAERDHRRTVDSELAGPRLTGWLLAALPLFGFAVAATLGSRPLDVLLGTPLGAACLAAAAALDAAGVAWLRALSRRGPHS
ncbi:MAG: rane protein, partial [Frankiales bacterium]|nr:rane protein [Frankiales bacterium]